MQATIEISMYPLNKDYEAPILAFIEDLKKDEELTVRVNAMSTQMVGDYDRLMTTLTAAMKKSFLGPSKIAMVFKVINGELPL
jgi:uncharacterized protein YqgV (UPF0045/DUF77 family)